MIRKLWRKQLFASLSAVVLLAPIPARLVAQGHGTTMEAESEEGGFDQESTLEGEASNCWVECQIAYGNIRNCPTHGREIFDHCFGLVFFTVCVYRPIGGGDPCPSCA